MYQKCVGINIYRDTHILKVYTHTNTHTHIHTHTHSKCIQYPYTFTQGQRVNNHSLIRVQPSVYKKRLRMPLRSPFSVSVIMQNSLLVHFSTPHHHVTLLIHAVPPSLGISFVKPDQLSWGGGYLSDTVVCLAYINPRVWSFIPQTKSKHKKKH
jgi:hypothetical protein